MSNIYGNTNPGMKTTLRLPLSGRVNTNGGTLGVGAAATDFTVIDVAGNLVTGANVAPVGITTMGVAHAIYDFASDGGAVSTITPVLTAALPANAIILGGFAKAGAALTAIAGTTFAIGTSAGSSTTSLLTAAHGAIANWAADAIIALEPTMAVPIELTAAGAITVTIGTHAVTAGQVEIFVFFVVPTYA